MTEEKEPITLKLTSPPKIKAKKKIKILWYSDFLRATGFGNVAEELVTRLEKTGRYEFRVLGINYNGTPYNIPGSQYYHLRNIPVFPARDGSDFLGQGKLAQMLSAGGFDIFFTLQDSFNMMGLKEAIEEAKEKNRFKYIFYFPVDGDVKKEWVKDGIKPADFPVSYTKYGVEQVQKHNSSLDLSIIPHGIDLKKFRPFAKEQEKWDFREKFFGMEDPKNTLLITNVNRNQQRKDIPRTMIAFREFCARNPKVKAKLYLHCIQNDVAGHDLYEIKKNYLPERLWGSVMNPSVEVFGENGFSTEVMRKIYASSDIITSTTLGEGCGMSTLEGMACGVPLAIPCNTATIDLIGRNNERGYLVKSGATPSEWCMLRNDNEIMRPLTNVEHLIDTWEHIYRNPKEAQKKVKAGLEWLQGYTWDKVADMWDDMFQKVYRLVQRG